MAITLEDIRNVYHRLYFEINEFQRLHFFHDVKLTGLVYYAVALEDTKTGEMIDYPDARLSEQEQLVEYHEYEGGYLLVKFSTENRFLTPDNEKGLNSDHISDTMYEYLQTLLEPAESEIRGLERVRRDGKFDFEIVSSEGKAIGVHTLVLSAVWPFFRALMDSNMEEVTEKKLVLPYPLEWIEIMVCFLYEEEQEVKKMTFEQALGGLVLSNVYNIPGLEEVAKGRVLKESLDVAKGVLGWKLGYEAQNEEIQLHMARFLSKRREDLRGSKEWKKLSQEEVDLLEEVVGVGDEAGGEN